MRKILIAGIISLLIPISSIADEAYQFNCELDERTSSSGTYQEKYKYVIKKDSEIAERKIEVFKKENGKFINLIDLSDEYMKREHTARQAWKTVNSTWTVDKLIFSLTDQHRNKVSEIIDRTSLQFAVNKSMIMSGVKMNMGSESGSCKVEKVNTKDRAF